MEYSDIKKIEDAHQTIKNKIIDLCDTYSTTIKTVLPTLSKAANQAKLSDADAITYKQLYSEANDHLHNLIQLKIEVTDLEKSDQNMLFELSSEILSNTLKFFLLLPEYIGKTEIYKKET
jgi:hypothetical protein